jgi:DUF1009 family protein
MIPHLGMIAGRGELPAMIARRAHEAGQPIPTIALSTEAKVQLAPYCPAIVQYGPGQLSHILRSLRRYAVRRVVIIGNISKQSLFKNPRLDLRAIRLLRQMPDYRDGTLFRTLCAELAREGVEVVEQTRVLRQLVTPPGVLGKRRPSAREWADIAYGFDRAKQLAGLDIGQTIVVRRQTVLAVEAIEGTDAAIIRGCKAASRGAIVVKVSRPQQDMRFDVPTVGPDTLRALIAGHAAALAVEAGTTLMMRLPELIETANGHRIALVGVTPAPARQPPEDGRNACHE